jgi:predicted nucleic-acid-binding Zn-ribbon protein
MTVQITCPKCKSAMQEGFVFDHGDFNVKMKPVRVEGAPEESFWSGLKTTNKAMFTVRAHRCPQCNYLEFYTAEEVSSSIWT